MIENMRHKQLIYPPLIRKRFGHVVPRAEDWRYFAGGVLVVKFLYRQALAIIWAVGEPGDVIEVAMNSGQ